MSAKIQLRRDTTWVGTETLAAGEVGIQFNAAGTVGGIKIGPVGGNTWSNIDYLSGTFPFADSSATSANDASLMKSGRFKWATATTITANAPISFAANDGAAMMTTSVYGTSVVQALSTEGNGTVPTKHFIRVYDGDGAAWRTWENVNTWATSSTDGTDLTAKNITAKNVVTIADGTLALPSVAFTTETNKGLYHKAANQLGVSVNGTAVAHFTATQLVTNSISCTTTSILSGGVTMGSTLGVTGVSTFTGGAAMASNRLTGVGDPTGAQDAVTKNYLEGTRIGSICFLNLVGSSIAKQQCGNSNAVTFTYNTPSDGNLRAPAGTTWSGVIGDGTGAFCWSIVNDSSHTRSGGSIGAISGTGALTVGGGAYWLILTRTA
jgi:hypothetical protein